MENRVVVLGDENTKVGLQRVGQMTFLDINVQLS